MRASGARESSSISELVVLASGSPQRKEILEKLGVEFEVVVSGVEARAYLDRMAGREHVVMSGLVVLAGGEERAGLERTSVFFKPLSDSEKERYVNFGEWRGRSGGYAIQTLGSTLVERVEGSVSNVVGLPVGLLIELAPALFSRR